MADYVDLLVLPEHEKRALNALDEWNKQLGSTQVWTIGEAGDGRRKLICDAATSALQDLTQRGIPFDTRPRDPGRQAPVFVAI